MVTFAKPRPRHPSVVTRPETETLDAAAGLGPWTCTVIGLPVLKKPIVAFTVCGGRSELNRKLYIVPQRIALAFAFCASVSEFHVIDPPACVCVHGALL